MKFYDLDKEIESDNDELIYLYCLARWADEKMKELGLHDKTVYEQLHEEQKE